MSHNLQSSGVGQHYSKGPNDPPSRSKHKGIQKNKPQKKTRVPESPGSLCGRSPPGRRHSGRTPGAPKTPKVRKHKKVKKVKNQKRRETRSPARGSHSPRACKINPEALPPRSASQSQHHNAGASFSSNCGGPLFDVLQSACSYNTAIQQKCGPKDTSASVHPRSKTTRK